MPSVWQPAEPLVLFLLSSDFRLSLLDDGAERLSSLLIPISIIAITATSHYSAVNMVQVLPWFCLCIGVSLSNAFAAKSNFLQNTRRYSAITSHETASSSTSDLAVVTDDDHQSDALTTVLLRISYDGSLFTGWSGNNSGAAASNSNKPPQQQLQPSRRQRKRGVLPEPKQGFVRPVERVIQTDLAKIYGNVDPNRVVVDGCSRTDKGVHAREMMAQIYCLTQEAYDALLEESSSDITSTIHRSIPGKRKPHPTSSTDSSYFESLAMNGNMSRMAFALNRMLPPDVRVTGIAPAPTLSGTKLPFHPSMSTVSKTYEYTISVGGIHDPTSCGFVWHLEHTDMLDIESMQESCRRIQGKNDFSAFQGAPRGTSNKRRRQENANKQGANVCTLSSITIKEQEKTFDDIFHGVDPPVRTFKIYITGDRFLYKMVRFLVGALVAVGKEKLESEDLDRALETGSWETADGTARKEFTCAPARGLSLRHVNYGDLPIDWQPLRN
jgi:tRNA pseudouridine38-40 synthase